MRKRSINKLSDRYWLNTEHQLWANVLYTSSWIKHQMAEILSDVDLTVQQARILIILNEQNGTPISTNVLRDRILEVGSDTPKLVNRLVEKELVDKATSQHDKRLLNVTLTNKGQEMIDRLTSDHLVRISNLFSGLMPGEMDELNKLLNKIHSKGKVGT